MKRDFKGIWIPAQIWLNKDLSLIEKCFIVEIDSLDNLNGCFASNAYFSDFFSISKSRCSQIIKSLESKNLISTEYHYEGKQITKRVLRILKGGVKFFKGGYLENAEDNNTKVNNTLLINNKNTKKVFFKKEELNQEIKKVSNATKQSNPLKSQKEKKEKVAPKRKKRFSVKDCKFPEVFEKNPRLKKMFLDFAEVRKELKKPYKTIKGTETKLNSLAKDCERYGVENVIGAIEFSMGSEWSGIFVHDYFKRQKQQQQNEKRTNNSGQQQTSPSIHKDFKQRLDADLAEELRLIRNNKMQE